MFASNIVTVTEELISTTSLIEETSRKSISGNYSAHFIFKVIICSDIISKGVSTAATYSFGTLGNEDIVA
jgi:hypothetical protein